MTDPLMSRKLACEAMGTFALVFAGTGAIVVDDLSGGSVTHVGVALTFGLVVMAMIQAVGDVSGAHLNPAVTLGFWVARRFPARAVPPYVAAQSLGALAASGLLRLLFTAHEGLGATVPSGPPAQAFALEVVLTFFLVFVILSVTTGAKERGITAGIAIGGVVCLCALFGGPISGASMNPARSLGPAVMAPQWHALWLYWLAPGLGALVAVAACRCARGPACCAVARPGEGAAL